MRAVPWQGKPQACLHHGPRRHQCFQAAPIFIHHGIQSAQPAQPTPGNQALCQPPAFGRVATKDKRSVTNHVKPPFHAGRRSAPQRAITGDWQEKTVAHDDGYQRKNRSSELAPSVQSLPENVQQNVECEGPRPYSQRREALRLRLLPTEVLAAGQSGSSPEETRLSIEQPLKAYLTGSFLALHATRKT